MVSRNCEMNTAGCKRLTEKYQISKDCVCCISQYLSSLLFGDLEFIIKLTAIPDFDRGKSHGRKMKISQKVLKNLEKSANPAPKSKDF